MSPAPPASEIVLAEADASVEELASAWPRLAPAARRLHRQMKLRQFSAYRFVESRAAVPNSRDAHLAVRTVMTPDADYPNLKRWDKVSPGYTWNLWRAVSADGDQLADAATITLTIHADRVARLRCGDVVRPATAKNWTELSSNIVEPLAADGVKMIGLSFRILWLHFSPSSWSSP